MQRLICNGILLAAVSFVVFGNTVTAGAQQTQQEPQQQVSPPQTAEFFDTDRNLLLIDSDGDGTPDLTESIEGTDPLDPDDFAGADTLELEQEIEQQFMAEAKAAGFPATSCRTGYRQAGPRLCISDSIQDATRYQYAQRRCRVQRGHVASYEDLYYLYQHSDLDASYNPRNRWIGNMVADDRALCGNRDITFDQDPDRNNFEGTCDKNDTRGYWCAHDRF